MQLTPSKAAIERGMMRTKMGETMVTEAGLFALACQIAYSPDGDLDNTQHCADGVSRVLDVAQSGGMQEMAIQVIRAAFASGIGAMDETEEGAALASLCRSVVLHAVPGAIGFLLSGEMGH